LINVKEIGYIEIRKWYGNWKLVGKIENGNWDCFASFAMTGVWDGILRFAQNDGCGVSGFPLSRE
jgi:hypothetical protein